MTSDLLYIDKICDYSVCPLKTTNIYSNNISSFEELKVLLTGQLVKYYYGALGRNGKVTLPDLNKRLGYLWAQHKSNISFNLNVDHYVGLTDRLKSIIGDVPMSVVGTDFPLQLHYKTITTLGDVDVLVRRSFDTLEAIWFDYSLYPCYNSRSFWVQLKSWFFYNTLNRVAYKYSSNIKIRVLRLVDLYSYTVDTSKNLELAKYITLFNELIDKGVYPRPDKVNCQACIYRRGCEWSTTAPTVM